MPAKQCALDFPIRKSRPVRTKSKVVEESLEISCGRTSRSRSKKNNVLYSLDSQPPSSVREHSISKPSNILPESSVERTPTKRKILQEYDQENHCSPLKVSPSLKHSEKVLPKTLLRKDNVQNAPYRSPTRQTTQRIPLSPVKFNSPERSLDPIGMMTRSQSPMKSPLKSLNQNGLGSPFKSMNLSRLNHSPAKSPLRRLELDCLPKSPARFGMASPLKSAAKCLDLNSLAKSSPLKRLDFGSPRRSPRKFNIEDCSPRRSPRKLPASPLKFSSPSSLVSTLSLSSPSSKKNISVALFKPNVTAYRAVRQSLNTGSPTTLVCRDEQIGAMRDFLMTHLEGGTPGSLYVSGAPGTGKTACLHSILDNMKNKHIKKVFINCMTLKTSASIYGKIVTELGLQPRGSEKENTRLIEKTLVNSKHPILIVLDEIDQLDSKNQEVLYSIFELPSLEDSKLVLVGIANALDLTDRILPRLQARPTFKPKLLHFPPYSKAEIIQIINQRIQQAGLGDVQIIRPAAIQFLAGKVASVAGDVRKALDVCRRAVELCEIQARKQSVLKLTSGSPRKSPRKDSALKMVDIPQVLAIFNEVYGSRVISAVTTAPDSFSLQQKLLICCLLLFLRHARSKDITFGKFHDVYTRVCKKRSIPGMDQSEFLTLCTLLESRGMLQVKRAKEIRSSKIFLRLNPEEAEQALGDRALLASVLADKECLGKLCKS